MTVPGPADPAPDGRAWWRLFEPVHAVTYFAPESRHGLSATGLRGFWMGYFGARAAPLGPVGAATVCATFFNFNPDMVRRAIPDAWVFADVPAILTARRSSAAAALRRIHPSVDATASALVPLLQRVVEVADGSGRALFSANRELVPLGDPVEALWQACTCLREHRGDGHVAALTVAGLEGCEALVLFAASQGVTAELFLESRGWSAAQWEEARRRLEDRGALHKDAITPSGRELRASIEAGTDRLASPPFAALSAPERSALELGLAEVAGAVVAAGDIPFPNPIGLPAWGSRGSCY